MDDYGEIFDLFKEDGGVDRAESQHGYGEEDGSADDREHAYDRAEDLIHAYFHSMGDIVILTKEEERALSKCFEGGKDMLRAIVTSMHLYREVSDRRRLAQGLQGSSPSDR